MVVRPKASGFPQSCTLFAWNYGIVGTFCDFSIDARTYGEMSAHLDILENPKTHNTNFVCFMIFDFNLNYPLFHKKPPRQSQMSLVSLAKNYAIKSYFPPSRCDKHQTSHVLCSLVQRFAKRVGEPSLPGR